MGTTFLGVKKPNFFIYLSFLLIGFILIGLSIMTFYCWGEHLLDEILLSVGCGFIPALLIAYCIDFVNEKREKRRMFRLRDSFLWGIPIGILSIMKSVIALYYPFKESLNNSFLKCFNDAIIKMENTTFDFSNFQLETEAIENLLKSLNYGLSLCIRDCESIKRHSYELEINDIFTKKQLSTMAFVYDECNNVLSAYKLNEMSDSLNSIVEESIKNIPEIEKMANRIAKIHNGRLKNWQEIIEQNIN